MRAYHLLTQQMCSFEEPFEVVAPLTAKPHFITISPHSGLLIPEAMLHVADLDSEQVRNEIFKDGDPFLDDFAFQAEGGISINALLHRFAGDLNRDSFNLRKNGFLREKSFNNFDLLKPGHTYSNDLIQFCRSYHRRFVQTVDGYVRSFTEPVFMAQIHAMDDVAGAAYGTGGGNKRPDLCLVFGESGAYMHPQLEKVLFESLHRELPDWRIAINDPFNGKGQSYYLLKRYGKPKKNWNACEIEINKGKYMLGREKDELSMLRIQRALSNAFREVTEAISLLKLAAVCPKGKVSR